MCTFIKRRCYTGSSTFRLSIRYLLFILFIQSIQLFVVVDYGYGNIKSLRDDTALATARAHEDWATIFVRKIRAEGLFFELLKKIC